MYVTEIFTFVRNDQHLKKSARQSLQMSKEARIYRRKQQLDKNQFFEQKEELLYGPDIAH